MVLTIEGMEVFGRTVECMCLREEGLLAMVYLWEHF